MNACWERARKGLDHHRVQCGIPHVCALLTVKLDVNIPLLWFDGQGVALLKVPFTLTPTIHASSGSVEVINAGDGVETILVWVQDPHMFGSIFGTEIVPPESVVATLLTTTIIRADGNGHIISGMHFRFWLLV